MRRLREKLTLGGPNGLANSNKDNNLPVDVADAAAGSGQSSRRELSTRSTTKVGKRSPSGRGTSTTKKKGRKTPTKSVATAPRRTPTKSKKRASRPRPTDGSLSDRSWSSYSGSSYTDSSFSDSDDGSPAKKRVGSKKASKSIRGRSLEPRPPLAWLTGEADMARELAKQLDRTAAMTTYIRSRSVAT